MSDEALDGGWMARVDVDGLLRAAAQASRLNATIKEGFEQVDQMLRRAVAAQDPLDRAKPAQACRISGMGLDSAGLSLPDFTYAHAENYAVVRMRVAYAMGGGQSSRDVEFRFHLGKGSARPKGWLGAFEQGLAERFDVEPSEKACEVMLEMASLISKSEGGDCAKRLAPAMERARACELAVAFPGFFGAGAGILRGDSLVVEGRGFIGVGCSPLGRVGASADAMFETLLK